MIRLAPIFALLPLLAACEPAAVEGSPTSAVHELARQGQTVPLIDAISASQGLDQRDICYRTPLMLAAQQGHVETVQALLARGARVDLHEKGYYTALMLAAGNGHAGVVRLLAEAGAVVDEVEIKDGWTALIRAAQRGHLETVRLLLDLGADPDVRDRQGRTARDWAVKQGNTEVAALL